MDEECVNRALHYEALQDLHKTIDRRRPVRPLDKHDDEYVPPGEVSEFVVCDRCEMDFLPKGRTSKDEVACPVCRHAERGSGRRRSERAASVGFRNASNGMAAQSLKTAGGVARLGEVVGLRRDGLSVPEIAEQLGVSEVYVFGLLRRHEQRTRCER